MVKIIHLATAISWRSVSSKTHILGQHQWISYRYRPINRISILRFSLDTDTRHALWEVGLFSIIFRGLFSITFHHCESSCYMDTLYNVYSTALKSTERGVYWHSLPAKWKVSSLPTGVGVKGTFPRRLIVKKRLRSSVGNGTRVAQEGTVRFTTRKVSPISAPKLENVFPSVVWTARWCYDSCFSHKTTGVPSDIPPRQTKEKIREGTVPP